MLSAGAARGNGAFPESDALLLPRDRPNEILLATNFGVILSEDGGTSWQWTCERAETSMGALYGVGPPPDDRLFSLSPDVGLAVSNDGSCSWRSAGGALTGVLASDYFPDPTSAAHVLAIATLARDSDGGGGASAVLVSNDGGESFDPSPLYTAPAGAALLGVEIARSDPRVVVLTELDGGSRPLLVKTSDGGGSWTSIDLQPKLGPHPVRLVAIDAANPQLVVLRVMVPAGDVLAITTDGGASFATPVTMADGGALTAFVRLASGTMLAAGFVPLGGTDAGGATRGVAWRSTDGGESFVAWTLSSPEPHIRALAERDGKLYLAGKNYSDGWAVAVSADEGRTLTPIATYDRVSAIKACAASICQDSCDNQAGLKVWSPEVCSGGVRDGSTDAGPPGGGGGCGCAVAVRVASRAPRRVPPGRLVRLRAFFGAWPAFRN